MKTALSATIGDHPRWFPTNNSLKNNRFTKFVVVDYASCHVGRKMECINQLSSLNLPEPSEANENDGLFMEIIREFPTIYNRASRDFKGRNKKAYSWKRIAE